jgi:metal-responsive CopG/Arc/MetJ family transcriptional regulator
MRRISVDLPDELEKKLRFKTIERFGGKKGDLSRAVEEAVKTWVAEEKKIYKKNSCLIKEPKFVS